MKKLFVLSFVFMFAATAAFQAPLSANAMEISSLASIQKEITSISKQVEALFVKVAQTFGTKNKSQNLASVSIAISAPVSAPAQVSGGTHNTDTTGITLNTGSNTGSPALVPGTLTETPEPMPTIKLTSPNLAATYGIGYPSQITWSANTDAGMDSVDIYLLKERPTGVDACRGPECTSPVVSFDTYSIVKNTKNVDGANSYNWLAGRIGIQTVAHGIAPIFVDEGNYRVKICPAGSLENCDESAESFMLVQSLSEPTDPTEPAMGDINADGSANLADIAVVINSWGACPVSDESALALCPADLNGDGDVGQPDIDIILANWSY